MIPEPKNMGTAGIALRLMALRGTAPYIIYLVEPGTSREVLDEIRADLESFDDTARVRVIVSSSGAARLLADLPAMSAGDILLIGAEGYQKTDWRLLDRQRSALSREGGTVFLTTTTSLDGLMRVAPNLASWLGGLVFSYQDMDGPALTEREERLAALRAWSGKTDAQVLEEATAGRLPRDPEYASWLVLLGRGDLLDGQ